MSAATRRPGAFLSLCFRVLDLVGLLVPPEFRADWKREWRAELWQRWRTFDAPGGDPDATHRIALFLRCFGAFPDALSLWSWSLDDLSHDLRYAARLLRRQFGFATVAALTLALGIGASTAIFSVVNAVLLRPLPYPEPDRLARIWSVNRGQDLTEAGVSIPDFADWRDGNRVAARIAAFSMLPTGLTLVGRDEPERLPTAYVTEDFFGTIGVPARLGRGILPEEHKDGANRVIVMSDALWRRRFGADPAVIGRAIPFESDVFTVVGVMPPGFDYPSPRAELWAPTSLIPESSIPRLRPVRWLNVIARLRPGVSPEAAQTAMNTVARRLEAQYPESNAGWGETGSCRCASRPSAGCAGRSSSSSAPSPSFSSSPASTSPTSSSPVPPRASARWPCAPPSAPAAGASSASSSPRAWCSRSSAARSALSSPRARCRRSSR